MTEWGDKITITDAAKMTKERLFKAALNEARERMYAEILNPSPRVKPRWTLKDRLELAWKALIGQITWDDIG